MTQRNLGLKITEIIWLPAVVDKIESRHRVTTGEVEELFGSRPRFRRIEAGEIAGEDLYAALGRTETGRFLIVFFIRKASQVALVISGREMTTKEKRAHARK